MLERFKHDPAINPETDDHQVDRLIFQGIEKAVNHQDYEEMIRIAYENPRLGQADLVEAMNELRRISPDEHEAQRWEIAIGQYVQTFDGKAFRAPEVERINVVIREVQNDTSAGREQASFYPTEEYDVEENEPIFGLSEDEQSKLRETQVFRDIEFEIDFTDRTTSDFARVIDMLSSGLGKGEVTIAEAQSIRKALDSRIVEKIGRITQGGEPSQLETFQAKCLADYASSREIGKRILAMHDL